MASFTYVPGTATAVCAGRIVALLGLAPGHELVPAVHAALARPEATVDDVLDVLVSLGLRTVATFAVAEATPAGVRVVVRGRARGDVPGAGVVTPVGLWENRFLDGADSATVTVADHDGPTLPLIGGVVLAASVTVATAASLPAAPPPVEPADAPDAPDSPSELQDGLESPHGSGVEDGSGAEEASGGEDGPEVEDGSEVEDASEGQDEAGVEDASGPVPDFDHLFGATQVPGTEPGEAASVGAVQGVPARGEHAGQTMASPHTGNLPENQAPLPPPATPAPGTPAPATPTPVGDDPDADPPQSANRSSGVPSRPDFIAGLPWEMGAAPVAAPPDRAVGAPPAAPVGAPPSGSGPVEPEAAASPELTVDRDQLPDHAATGPLVVAARCPRGHLSPAHAGNCRVCGQALAAQEPFEVPRPPLGVLRLANGDTVRLDRGAILGRHPRLPQGWSDEQPNLVKIPDPERDISGQHVAIRLDYWHVLVTDLGSTNGTEVVLPGAEPVTLRAHDAMAIEPGTRVILAGVFDLTFEVEP